MLPVIVPLKVMRKCVTGVLMLEPSLRWIAPNLDQLTDNPSAIGDALYALNEAEAMWAYSGRPEDDIPPSPRLNEMVAPAYVHQEKDASPIACYAALKFLDRNCGDGPVEKSVMFIELQQVMGALADLIVMSLPEYRHEASRYARKAKAKTKRSR
jgi:hypothetical protein